MTAGAVPTVPQLVQDVMRVRDELDVSLAIAFERICQWYDIEDSRKYDLRHQVMEYMRMVRQ